MRLCLHIGPDAKSSTRLQTVLAAHRKTLARRGVLFPRTPGARNHTRAFMAVSDQVETLRHHRGHGTRAAQARLRAEVAAMLAREVAAARPDVVILCAHQLGAQLTHPAALAALHDMLEPLNADIEIIAHVDQPARMLARHHAQQVFEGRARSLALEMGFLRPGKSSGASWWDQARRSTPQAAPHRGIFPDVQGAPAFIDLKSWVRFWEDGFGPRCLRLRPMNRKALTRGATTALTAELQDSFAIDMPEARDPASQPLLEPRSETRAEPSAEWLARARAFNDLLLRRLAREDLALPRQLWRSFLREMRCGGPRVVPAALAPVDVFFASDISALIAAHPALAGMATVPKPADTRKPQTGELQDPPFTNGFRASQYLLAALGRIPPRQVRDIPDNRATASSDTAQSTQLPPQAQAILQKLASSPYAPHNRLGRIDETRCEAPYAPRPSRDLPRGSSGKVIVGCMKNEAPYIVKWVAFHRAIGIDNFLIYTNGCEDGTPALLERLQEMGVLQHRDNDAWRGNSPQQHALNRALQEPVIRRADWITHIDIDEFINVRCGNGTLDDLLARLPEATHIAMTWRLFGHNGVTGLSDDLVTAQFDSCAPSYCPKPHTAWGFKTLFRNTGAYGKLSCHRPNKLKPAHAASVHWVNGSGAPLGADIKTRGWRNSRETIGYDLVQLNHYALRSAENFLIKRQRGRALHVDRNIGLHYWIRMDWSDARDLTIQRNLPRVRAERDRLLRDDRLRALHAAGLAWHRARASDLRRDPAFAALFDTMRTLRLTAAERAAYALALDMET